MLQLAFEFFDPGSGVCAQTSGPAPASDLPAVGVFYHAFTAHDTTVEEAAAAFLRRYGCAAAEVRPGLGGLLLVGPVPVGVGQGG